MAAQAIDRASQRVVLGGGFMRTPHSAWALAKPKARSIFGFPCVPCVLQKEAWPALASEEMCCELHWQLNAMKASLACTCVVSGRSRGRVKLTGSDLRSLAAALPDDNEHVIDAERDAYLCVLWTMYAISMSDRELFLRTFVIN